MCWCRYYRHDFHSSDYIYSDFDNSITKCLDWRSFMKMVYEKYRVLKFEDYDKQWLDFIVSSRNGEKPWSEYDMIEGGVANDHVIDTIEAYMNGYMTIEMALGQLALHRPNNQICLLNQQLIDACLHFKSTESLNSQSHA